MSVNDTTATALTGAITISSRYVRRDRDPLKLCSTREGTAKRSFRKRRMDRSRRWQRVRASRRQRAGHLQDGKDVSGDQLNARRQCRSKANHRLGAFCSILQQIKTRHPLGERVECNVVGGSVRTNFILPANRFCTSIRIIFNNYIRRPIFACSAKTAEATEMVTRYRSVSIFP